MARVKAELARLNFQLLSWGTSLRVFLADNRDGDFSG